MAPSFDQSRVDREGGRQIRLSGREQEEADALARNVRSAEVTEIEWANGR
jgi:hypothetical protein